MSRVQSIQRAFQVMQQLASAEMGVTDLSAAVELPKSTVARLLKTLEMEGAVERIEDGGRYRIGPLITALAGATMRATDLVARVRPHLAVLARETGEDAGLSVPDGYQVHYIDQVGSDNPVVVRDWTGELVPMHAVPSGLVMLAHWPDEALDRYLRRPLQRFTQATMTDPDELRKRLIQVRDDGFAWGFEEFAEGINSVAAPVLDSRGRPLAAIHVHGPAYRFPPDDRMLDFAALVVQKAALMADQSGAHRIS